MSNEAADALRTASDVLRVVGTTAPEPFGMVARLLGVAAGAISVLVADGKTEAECVAEIHRVTRIDTTATDAAADARIEARRRLELAETERAVRADEPTGRIGPR